MATREEIREGIKNLLETWLGGTAYGLSGKLSIAMVEYLHSQGVVIKVDGELPRLTEKSTGIEYIKIDGYWTQAGYVAVESLI